VKLECRGLVFGRYWVQISDRLPVSLTEALGSISQPLQASAGLVPRIGHDIFLPYYFQFIIYQPYYRSSLYVLDTESIVQQSRKEDTFVNLCVSPIISKRHGRDANYLFESIKSAILKKMFYFRIRHLSNRIAIRNFLGASERYIILLFYSV
jgi:hypothetical protein